MYVADKRVELHLCVTLSGTHLTYEIIRMLVSGEAEYRKNPKEETWIEIHPYKEIMQVPVYGRRILNTHLVPGWIPPNFR